MSAAFLRSDYYGGSELVGLASRRVSRVCAHETLSTCRCPSVPCQAHYLLLAGESVASVSTALTYSSVVASGMLRRVWPHRAELRFDSPCLTMRTELAKPWSTYLRSVSALGACCCPRWVSPRSKLLFLRSLLSTSPASGRNFISADTAHVDVPGIKSGISGQIAGEKAQVGNQLDGERHE